ncbi:flagellar hook-associated protein FlgK (plasmid) [Azospirillum argentinense]|uniref:Flagellar hook-associated protein 1 n=1 Tax=Azospirillum argentinense TaxID=2970906 RepID=A0A4D8PS09_9PROT|nr:flagellar hook-associated protein FlgK [Azospirillum argentinense]QCN97919.1 flagellar hook-associated protein FlgK [Azospirillum argentinense]
MSLFGALGSATASLRAVQAQVKLVSDNVARADDPTRTRHTVSNVLDSNGFVLTSQYRREVDSALLSQVQDLTAREGSSSTKSSYMQQLGDLLRTTSGKPQLNEYAEAFQTAWKAVETSPESEVAQYQLIQAADTFAREINRVSQGVEDMDREIQGDLSQSVGEVNRLLKEIESINNNIVSLQGYGSAGNEVADKRDGLIRELSTYVGVRTMARPDGRIAVFTPTGLALVDSQAANLSYEGGNINLTVGNQVTNVNQHLKEGKVAALMNLRADGSTASPPQAASADPTTEVIRKLRSQLDAYAQMFTGSTKPGEPTSFRDAYDQAKTVPGEEGTQFFMGNDRFTIHVNENLLNNTKKLKSAAVKDVVTALSATGRSFQSDGLKLEGASFSSITSNITGGWMSAAKTAMDKSSLDKDSRQILEERYHATTGVNIDEEIANLQQLQTSYAASARVMQVANTMFDALEAIVR